MQKYVKLFCNMFMFYFRYVLDIWHTSCPWRLLELRYQAYASCRASQISLLSQNIALFLCKNFMFNNELFSSIDDSFVDNCLFSKQSATLHVQIELFHFLSKCFKVGQFINFRCVSGPYISLGDAHEWLNCLQSCNLRLLRPARRASNNSWLASWCSWLKISKLTSAQQTPGRSVFYIKHAKAVSTSFEK